jgi:hypothetical protein
MEGKETGQKARTGICRHQQRGHVNLFTSPLSSSVMEVKKSSLCFETTLAEGVQHYMSGTVHKTHQFWRASLPFYYTLLHKTKQGRTSGNCKLELQASFTFLYLLFPRTIFGYTLKQELATAWYVG